MTEDTDKGYDEDRKHPVVTEGDWGMWTDDTYFKGKKYPAQSRSQQEGALRRRLFNTLLDLHLVFGYMPSEERERVYEMLSNTEGVNLFDWSREEGEGELQALTALGAILYEATDPAGVPFEFVLEKAVRRVIEQNIDEIPPGHGLAISVAMPDIDVEIEPLEGPQIDTALQKLNSGADFEDLEYGELMNYARWADSAGSFAPGAVEEEWNDYFDAVAADARQSESIEETQQGEDADTDKGD